MPVTEQISIINEIESALSNSPSEKRVQTLVRVTDLFLNEASRYSEKETKLFDDVMGHLITHVEDRVLVELSARLAPVDNAPLSTIQFLARNDAIEISGPVLTSSKRLSDDDLIEIAQTKSQAHLAKIAVRSQLNEGVTEVLVDRGDDEVVNKVATNAGARLSETIKAELVMRANGDDRLTESMSRRADISPPLFRHLMLQATDFVRAKLLASAAPNQRDAIKKILNEISVQAGKNNRNTRNYAEAQRVVASFSQDTDLARKKLLEFADANRVVEMIAALSVLSSVPIDQIDKVFSAPSELGMMILCKASALDLNTAYSVITARRGKLTQVNSESYDTFCEQYDALSILSAQRVIRFWQGRQKIAKHFPEAQS